MLFRNIPTTSTTIKNVLLGSNYYFCRINVSPKCLYSQKLEEKYSDDEKGKILSVLNETDLSEFSRFDLAKIRLKKFADWKKSNSQVKSLTNFAQIDGMTERIAAKLFDSILSGGNESNGKIRGLILHPNLSEKMRQSCKSVLTVYIATNSVSWVLIDRPGYEVVRWHYYGIDYKDEKKMQITDIMDIGWRVFQQLPEADLCVMKAESTTLRAAGSDPKNPKVLSVNLQKAQLVAIIVALINSKGYSDTKKESSSSQNLQQKVYFLKPTLPFRLYGTLVGNEQISTEQVVEMILQETIEQKSSDGSNIYIPENTKTMFRTMPDLQKDMLGHCLLMAMTFMDLCIYKNKERLNKLLNSE